MPATILLKAFGYSTDDLLRMYYPVEEIRFPAGKLFRKLDPEIHHGLKCSTEVMEKGGKGSDCPRRSEVDEGSDCQTKAAWDQGKFPSPC